MWSIALLGPVEVRRDGEPVAIPAGKPSELLVRLALDVARPVGVDRLIEDLWGDGALSTARNTLQSKVSQLRRALGASDVVAAGNGAYTLVVDPGEVDAVRVVDLSARASAAVRAGDVQAALAAAGEGLALFRGEVLAGAGDGSWLHPHRVRLEEVRLGLVEDELEARVEVGGGGDVIGRAESLVAEHPLRERLWQSLITALYRAGRQGDALAAYARVRALLVSELGIEPGPGLQSLERQVLNQSPDLAGRVGDVRDFQGRSGNLAALSASLVGRGDDVERVADLVRDHRLVTLVGPAGVGKSRTALEVARRLEVPGGVWLVRLDAVDSTTDLARLVAETMHVSGDEALPARLRETTTVLVLDNCEHVVESAGELLERLLGHADDLRVLATSQVPLGVDGEATHQLDPLDDEASVALFTERAVRARPRLQLDEASLLVVQDICRRLDGLPLAIELAAARAKSLSVQEISRRLDDRFALLKDPSSRRPDRWHALSAAIAWSYDLLFPDDQRGLWALATFAGGAPLAAVEHVLTALEVPTAAAVDVVDRLVDRSLVGLDIDAHGGVRYRLLDSVRAFAAQRLDDAGLADVARAAHAGWFAEAARRCAADVHGPDQADCVDFVRAERENVDAALAWTATHAPATGLRIANGLAWVWVVLGDGVAGAQRLRSSLAAAVGEVGPREEAEALLLAGWLEASAGNPGQSETDLDAAGRLAEQSGDVVLRADVQRHRAFLRIQQGRAHEVLAEANAALAVYRASPDQRWATGGTLLLLSYGAVVLGDTVGAARASDEAYDLLVPTGDSWALLHTEAMRATIAQAERRFDEAARALAVAAERAEHLGFLGQAALHLARLGRVEHRAGKPAAAADTLHRAVAAAHAAADLRLAATARTHLARVHRAMGEESAARVLLEQADRWYGQAGGGDGSLLTRCLLLAVTLAQIETEDGTPVGRPHDSLDGSGPNVAAELESVLAEAVQVEDIEVQVLTLDALARWSMAIGDAPDALKRLDSADALVGAVQHLLDDADRVDAHVARSEPDPVVRLSPQRCRPPEPATRRVYTSHVTTVEPR